MGGAIVPLSQVVLKVQSLCDLSCDHCYVYEAADQSWRTRPKVISDKVVAQAGRRIAEHAAAHSLAEVQVVLHGGEPLLAGYDRLQAIITGLHEALAGTCRVDLRIHTNGVQLSVELCELFAKYRVKVGISLDGDQAANDRHRVYANGQSSYGKVIRAIELLNAGRFRSLFAGLLCTIDVANDPLVVYESLMALRPPRIDFLLPHATWDHPPARRPGAEHEYADWLTAISDRWISDGRPAEIRTFDSIISTLRGGESLTEALGLGPTGLVVIETDGSYEQVDSLKVAYEGAPETGLNVFSHSLDMVARHPGIAAREQGIAGLCQTCRDCPVVGSCGGGLYTHRYRDGSGFDNPSVYCADLLALISHVGTHHPTHTISAAGFAALGAGLGEAAEVNSLVQAQRSLVRALMAAVYQEAISSAAVPESVKARLRAAWSVLAAVEQDRPEALAALLGHPYLRAWAVHSLEHVREFATRPGAADPAADNRRLAADVGHLGAVAAAAAVRAGWAAPSRCPSSAPPSACRRWADWCSVRSQARRTLTTRPRPQPSASSAMRSSFRSAIRAGRSVWLGCWPARPTRSRRPAAPGTLTGSRCERCARPAGAWRSTTPMCIGTASHGRPRPGSPRLRCRAGGTIFGWPGSGSRLSTRPTRQAWRPG